MNTKKVTWKSYFPLALVIFASLSWFLLDPIGQATNESATKYVFYFIIAGSIIPLLFSIAAFFSKTEKPVIPVITLLLSLLNLGLFAFFVWFASNFV